MELHPYFEKSSTVPQDNLWYVLATEGDPPSMRVGSTASFVHHNKEDTDGKIYVIGGANPDGTFSEVNVLDLMTMSWDRIDTPLKISRYEHAVATVESSENDSIIVFGGAIQSGNLNDVQQYFLKDDRWCEVSIRGNAPSPRTHHSMSSFLKNGKLVVYSGGQSRSEPVTDRQVHILDIANLTWSTPYVTGQPPKPRHGHLLVTYQDNEESDSKVYIHGGMKGNTFYGDLFVLDLDKNQWDELRYGRKKPCGRAAHGGVMWKQKLYIFGGICKNGALDDMWYFETVQKSWTEIKYLGPAPPSRLDFACCLFTICKTGSQIYRDSGIKRITCNVASESKSDDLQLQSASSSNTTREMAESRQDQTDNLKELYVFFLICGGMDTEGTIFDDTLVFLIDIVRINEPE